jgi:folate-dependent phosphoribosylglycinamide formyltransferase PurN
LALLTLDALAASLAVRRFAARWRDDIALVALSDPFRPQKGGVLGQARHLLGHSGPRLLPYLAVNFILPRLSAAFRRPAGHDTDTTPLRLLAPRLGLKTETVTDVNAPAFHDRLRSLGVEAIVTFHFDQILSAATIAVAPCGGINVHAGLLPEQRGPTPTLHALLTPTPSFGVTLHRLAPRIDAGAILAREEIALPAGTSGLAAAERLHLAALPLLDAVLEDFLAGTARSRPMGPGPYRSFPTASELRRIREFGHRAVAWADIRKALRTPL